MALVYLIFIHLFFNEKCYTNFYDFEKIIENYNNC